MPITARFYIGTVVALGCAIFIGCVSLDHRLPDLTRFVHCLVLAILASTFKIRLPRMDSNISLNFVMFLVGIAALSWTENIAMTAIAILVQANWRPKSRPGLLKMSFNVSAMITSVAAARFASELFTDAAAVVPALIVAATIMFILDTWLVSTVLALINRQPVLGIWRNCHQSVFMYYLLGAIMAVVVTAYSRVCGWPQAMAMLPGLYLLYTYYDVHVARERELVRA
jgi:hypothetical protein